MVSSLGVLALAVGAVAGCGDDDESPSEDVDVMLRDLEALENRIQALEQEFANMRGVDEADDGIVVDEPPLFAQSVTITGEVADVLDDAGFVVTGPDEVVAELGRPGEGILVVAEEGHDVAVGDVVSLGDVVEVIGHMDVFVVSTIEDQLGTDLDDDAYQEWQGHLVLRAESIDTDPAEQ